MEEKVIQTRTCTQCQKSFDTTNKDMEFYDKISPVFGGKKYGIPSPKLCPNCRQQRRASFRNERNLYKINCDNDHKQVISIYNPQKKHIIYDQSLCGLVLIQKLYQKNEIFETKVFQNHLFPN